MSRVYIAGPMTGYPAFNYPAFEYAATVLRAQGIDVRCPTDVDPDEQPGQRTWEWYMRRTLRMLLDCDRIILLPGWENSRGARIERDLAETLGMDITEWTGSLTLPPPTAHEPTQPETEATHGGL